MLFAPWFNRRSTLLMNRSDTIFVVTTGRHSWGPWTRLNYAVAGMKKPHVIIAGAGTHIHWLRNGVYINDDVWERRMKEGFDKPVIQKKLSEFLTIKQLSEYTVPNDSMIVVTLYGKRLDEVALLREEIETQLRKYNVKVILSEQLFFKNTPGLFNGYAIIVPGAAGKDSSSMHILTEFEKKYREPMDMLAFGDASIDVPLLTMKQPPGTASFKSYGVHLTPLARRVVLGMETGTAPVLLEGSAPQSIYKVLTEHYRSVRNSPYRALLSPFEELIDRTVHPQMTPNELTGQGLKDVQTGLKRGGIGGFLRVTKGHLLDAADGIRARRHPEQKTDDGQLVDVYADRMKEYWELAGRGRYEAALSCILPSIARAQAEALGKTVPELDAAGGSALTRTRRLLASLLLNTFGFHGKSEEIDDRIAAANLATFRRRRDTANGFSWNVSQLKNYDRTSLLRLFLLIDLLQNQYAEVSKTEKVSLSELKEYLAVDTKKLRPQLKLPDRDKTKGVFS
jgi:hypothetical protein